MSRRRWAIGILVAWAVSLGFLVRREFFRTTAARLADAALSVPPGAVYYRVDAGTQQIGYVSSTVDTLKDTITVADVLVLDVPALGVLHRTTARSTTRLSRALRLLDVNATFEEDRHLGRAHARMVRDSVLALTVVSGLDSQETQLHLDRSFVLPSLLPLRLAFGGDLKKGSTYDVRVFDPAMLTLRDVAVRVAAETTLATPDSAEYDSTAMAWTPVHLDTVRAFRIEASADGETTRMWIDGEGRIVRQEFAQGLTLSRTSYELAAENFRHRDTARIARASIDPPAGAIVPVTAAAAGIPFGSPLAMLRVRFSGAPAEAFALAGDGQTLAGDTVVIRRAVPESLTPRYRLPTRDTAFAAELRAEPLIPEGDPRLVFPLMGIIRMERDPVRVAALLTHWVAGRVRPSADVALPSALLAIESGRGDANGATALYLALARSAGLPARAAAGVVYLRGRFYYHAWPEVWLGRWVPVDPVADQFPADAAHLRLAVGTLARRAELVRRLGTLKLEAP